MVRSCLFRWSFTCQNLAVNARNRAKTTVQLQSYGPATQWKTGRTTKMGKKGKNVENLSRSRMGKNGRKIQKKWKIGPIFHFSVFSSHFFPIFDRGKFSTIFSFLSHFCRLARFLLCSRPARLQQDCSCFWDFDPFFSGTLSPLIRIVGGICSVSSRPWPPCTLPAQRTPPY